MQTCVVHLVRNSLRSAAKEGLAQNHEKASRGLYRSNAWCCGNIIRGVHKGEWRERYPAILRLWEHSWTEHTAFFLISLSSFTRWFLPPTLSNPSTPGSVKQHDNGDTSQPNKQPSKSRTPQPRKNDQDAKTSQEKSPTGNTPSTS